MSAEPSSAGDVDPRECRIIEVRVGELRAGSCSTPIDPSPFRECDLDPAVEKFIVDWSRALPVDALLALVVHLDCGAGMSDEATIFRVSLPRV
jgi:hypothetical protein